MSGSSRTTTTITVRVPIAVKADLEALARSMDMPLSTMVSGLLERRALRYRAAIDRLNEED